MYVVILKYCAFLLFLYTFLELFILLNTGAFAYSQVEAEVKRLENLKSSKMKELILKKKSELEEICRQAHMVVESHSLKHFAVEAIDSGNNLNLNYK